MLYFVEHLLIVDKTSENITLLIYAAVEHYTYLQTEQGHSCSHTLHKSETLCMLLILQWMVLRNRM